MNSIDKMKALMKEYFGITVPMYIIRTMNQLSIGMILIKIRYVH